MSEIYPKIRLSDAEVETLKSRREIIQGKKKEIEDKIKHYEKLVKKYGRLKTGLIIGGITIGGLTGAASVILSAVCPILSLPLILGIISGVSGTIQELSALTFIKFKKDKFSKKLEIHTKYLNQLRYCYSKCIDDGIITKEEMEEFYKIVNEYENEVSSFKNESDKKEQDILSKLKILAKKEALIEAQNEVENELKNKEVERLKSQMTLN